MRVEDHGNLMGHVVTAPLVIVRTQDGGMVHLYSGTPVPGNADPKDVKRLAGEGFLSNIPDASPVADRPAGNANQEAWASYAVASGQATEDEVKGLSRDDLRGLYS